MGQAAGEEVEAAYQQYLVGGDAQGGFVRIGAMNTRGFKGAGGDLGKKYPLLDYMIEKKLDIVLMTEHKCVVCGEEVCCNELTWAARQRVNNNVVKAVFKVTCECVCETTNRASKLPGHLGEYKIYVLRRRMGQCEEGLRTSWKRGEARL